MRIRMPSLSEVLKPTVSLSVRVLGRSLAGQLKVMRPPPFPKIYVVPAGKDNKRMQRLACITESLTLNAFQRCTEEPFNLLNWKELTDKVKYKSKRPIHIHTRIYIHLKMLFSPPTLFILFLDKKKWRNFTQKLLVNCTHIYIEWQIYIELNMKFRSRKTEKVFVFTA